MLILLLFVLFVPESNSQSSHETYLSFVSNGYNDHPCSSKAGAAFGYRLNDKPFDELCLQSYYHYGLNNGSKLYSGKRYYMYWCTGHKYRQGMIDLFNRNTTATIFYINEWGFPNQCQTTDKEYISDLIWLIETFPELKIIVGNTYGHDSINDYEQLRHQLDLIESSSVEFSQLYGIAIHDYTLDDPHPPVQKLRKLKKEYGIERLPIFVSEFNAHLGNIDEYLNYYEDSADIKAYFYYAPCNPINGRNLVVRIVYPNGTEWPRQNCSFDGLTSVGQKFKETLWN